MTQIERKKLITYRWWRDDKGEVNPDHVQELEAHADERIDKMCREGYSSGELYTNLPVLGSDPETGIDYTGWWEVSTPDETVPKQASVSSLVFGFKPPAWVDSPPPETADEALQRAYDMARCIYPLGVKSGIHAMIEWCGVMTEYVKMLDEASKNGHDPREIDKHHSTSSAVPDFMVDYFCEKLGCQLIPFISGNPARWREQFDGWFKEATQQTNTTIQ